MQETADSLVFTGAYEDLAILLIKRGKDPYKGFWALPGGFINKDEDHFLAAKRELLEETGLDLKQAEEIRLSIYQKEGRDPRGATRTFPYLFYIPKQVNVLGGDDAVQAEWVDLKNIDTLSFDHEEMILEALGKTYSYMPDYDEKFSLLCLSSFYKKNIRPTDEIVFFPGTFSPWHEGHSECIRQCQKYFPQKRIVVLPDKNPWKKNDLRKNYYLLWKKLCSDFESTNIEICPSLLGTEEEKYTSSWLPHTKGRSKSLLLGDDTFFDLPRWKNYEFLIKSLQEIIVVPRLRKKEEILKYRKELLLKFKDIKISVLDEHSFKNLASSKL